jgi:hypothetical protein
MPGRPTCVALVLALIAVLATLVPDRGAALPEHDRSAALFTRMATVLTSPRCMNCHTVTDFPRQGDDRHRHFLNVRRGGDNHGVAGMRCSTCHASANQTVADVPGAPRWGLAPLSMGWEGKSVHQICVALLDRSKNGDRSVAALVRHMSYDPLVGWAWHPGGSRTTPPIDRAAFRHVVAEWAATGAQCP